MRTFAMLLAGSLLAGPALVAAGDGALTAPQVEQLRVLRGVLDDASLSEGERLEHARRTLDRCLGREDWQATEPERPPMSGMSIPRGLSGRRADLPQAPPSSASAQSAPVPRARGGDSLFEEMERMRAMMDQMAPMPGFALQGRLADAGAGQPEVSMTDEGEQYRLQLTFPEGQSGDDVEVRIDARGVHLSGEQQYAVEQRDADGKVVRSEQRRSKFHRVLPLASKVNPGAATTERHDDGSMTIVLPKAK